MAFAMGHFHQSKFNEDNRLRCLKRVVATRYFPCKHLVVGQLTQLECCNGWRRAPEKRQADKRRKGAALHVKEQLGCVRLRCA